MNTISCQYRDCISTHLTPKRPRVLFISSVLGTSLTAKADSLGSDYWRENLERPVQFYSAAKRLVEEFPGISVHLEVGPHSALAGPLRQIYAEQGAASIYYCSSLTRGKHDGDSFAATAGHLYCAGTPVSPPVSQSTKVITGLPTFPWHYDGRVWSETRVMAKWRSHQHPLHDLLGLRVVESSDLEPVWRNVLRFADVPWLQDHVLHNNVVFPAAGYVAMAGVAASQLGDGSAGYTVRDVHLSNAMMLQENKDTEVMTTLRPHRLTAKQDSIWYEFNITSHHHAAGWVSHCHGLVTNGRHGVAATQNDGDEAINATALARNVDSERWYKALSRVGLRYGSRFRGLRNMTASVTEQRVSASVQDVQEQWESSYAMHPVALDMVLQSSTVTHVRGVYRNLNKLEVPTYMGELQVGCVPPGAILHLSTWACKDERSSCASIDGKPVFSLRQLTMVPLDDGEGAGSKEKAAYKMQHLQWMPAFDFVDFTKLVKPGRDATSQLELVERLFVLCTIEAAQNDAVGMEPSPPHFSRFVNWMHKQVERFSQPGYPLVPDSAALLGLSSASRRQMIQDCLKSIPSVDALPWGIAIWRAYHHIADVIAGRVDYLDLLHQDGLLTKVYSWQNDLQDLSTLFRLLGNNRPQLRILEVGAGTGGLTAKILNSLQSDYGERLYLKYTFTDISAGFFVQAQDRFKAYTSLEYRVLDISQNPLEQGFKAGSYDLVVASNVLHATPYLVDTLRHCRTLLRDDGYLFLQELSPLTKSANFMMGLFSGWWLGADDGRADEPYISPDEWNIRLGQSGFEKMSQFVWDHEPPYHMNANMIVRPAAGGDALPAAKSLSFTLLTRSEKLGDVEIACATKTALEEQGYEVDHRVWAKDKLLDRPGHGLISFIDVERKAGPLLRNVSEGDLQLLVDLIDQHSQSSLLWLTEPTQLSCQCPHQAQILGVARTARLELGMQFATLELDNLDRGAARIVAKIAHKLLSANNANSNNSHGEDSALDPDMEYALRDETVYISRFHWRPVDRALADITRVEATATNDAVKHMVFGQCGALQSLQWRALFLDDLGPEEVRIQTSAIGMNFKELLHALGVIPIHSEGERVGEVSGSGLEGAGRVLAIGSAVNHVQVGDRVMWLSVDRPGFATQVQIPSAWCVKTPDHLSDEAAATMPVVYYTVISCLVDKANLQRGQSVLIHSATGGVGIAAIHVARWIGAEIYVTVGTSDKVDFVNREFGIPRDRIFHSRDESFVNDIMKATNKAGMDVVLNSLSGELLHASWKCVAMHGCMVEIGQRDLLGHGKLAMAPFLSNRTFTCFNGTQIIYDKRRTQRMLEQLVDLSSRGLIHPIRPITVFDAVHAQDAFRFMQQGQHIGKLVVKFPQNPHDDDKLALPLTQIAPEPSFKSDASYLLVGGTGGLGKSVASWMVSHGARYLIFLSRSAGHGHEHQRFFNELQQGGCRVQCFAGDVADEKLVRAAVMGATQPIAGVIQMAMVLNDVSIVNVDAAAWAAATGPKVDGTWNLHHLLPKDLDFFVLFSSMAGLFGHFGQANYAAANAFLDAFVQYRHAHGLEASVLDLGPIDDVGYVAELPTQHRVTSHAELVREEDFLRVLHLATVKKQPRPQQQQQQSSLRRADHVSDIGSYQGLNQFGMMAPSTLPIADPDNNVIWKRDPRMAIYRNIENMGSSSDSCDAPDAVRSFVASLATDPLKLNDKATARFLASAIESRVASFLMLRDDTKLDLAQPLAALGVDSLVSIELRNWCKQAFGINVTVLELMNSGSIEELGNLVVSRLKTKYTGSSQKTESRALGK